MRGSHVLLALLICCVGASVTRVLPPRSFNLQALRSADGTCSVFTSGWTQGHRLAVDTPVVDSRPALSAHEDEPASVERIITVFATTDVVAKQTLLEHCTNVSYTKVQAANNNAEVTKLIDGGEPMNRIDAVFMGDGYTAEERSRWYSDINRLIEEMFQDITFATYLPVFNIWSVYRPSVDSGIGVGGVPLDTSYRLYRDGTTLRGITTGNPAAARADCQLTGPDACDFPSIIGNSEFYGGRGGEFTVGTRSFDTGTMVLRHEMGHNYASVGEEYDGGASYFGANNARSLSEAETKWGAWWNGSTGPEMRIEDAEMRLQAYPWHDMDLHGPLSLHFESDGTYDRAMMTLSISGCPDEGDFIMTLDGNRVPLEAPGTLDRSFYVVPFNEGFTAGQHTLTFTAGPRRSNESVPQVFRQVCSVRAHDYKGDNNGFVWEEHYSAYRTWSSSGVVSYRPTNEYCLMRNMSSPVFCSACKESIWLRFLTRMTLYDEIRIEKEASKVTVTAEMVGLAQFRSEPVDLPGELLTIKWFHNNNPVEELENKFEWTDELSNAAGDWRAEITYETPEVRTDPDNLLHNSVSFVVQ